MFQKIRLNIIHLRAKVGGRNAAPPTSNTNSTYIVKSLHRKTTTKDMHSGFFQTFLLEEKRTRFVSYGVVEENEPQTSCLIVQQI